MKKLNYQKVFETLVEKTKNYLEFYNIETMILGISGGIDSTVVAAICSEIHKRNSSIKFHGVSMPIKNKEDEFSSSVIVGKAFCGEDNFEIFELKETYDLVSQDFIESKRAFLIKNEGCVISNISTPISQGNIQARLRMMYLYDLASIGKGIVFSTDNATEYNLGFWTLHGDVGDFNPLFGLWKTEVYGLAEWLISNYYKPGEDDNKIEALKLSSGLTPTDGLGISESDLEQIGGSSYEEVEKVLIDILDYNIIKSLCSHKNIDKVDSMVEKYIDWSSGAKENPELYRKIAWRHFASEFKRKNLPIVIKRFEFE